MISVMRRSYGYAGDFVPYICMAAAYLRREMEYGNFIQAQFAFSEVESSLSYFVNNIDDMARWWAGISRLEGFQASVEGINKEAECREAVAKKTVDLEESVPRGCQHPEGIVIRQVSVRAPGSEQLLVEDLNLTVGPGERLLVVGTSGCGKTSLLRVASGLWRPEAGVVERPEVGRLLFVPQRPYMLLGTLREQLCYPLPQDSFDDNQLRTALARVHLAHLAERYPDLGVKQDWPRLLSLGEQQRLAFARLVLNKPDFAVLDEATSALDVKTEQLLYGLLIERGVAVISVGHRPTLKAYHDQVLELRGQGAWRLMPATSYDFATSGEEENQCSI